MYKKAVHVTLKGVYYVISFKFASAKSNYSCACVSLLLDSVDDPSRFVLVKFDQEGRVLGIVEKPSVEEAKFYRSNGGVLEIGGLLVFKPEIFDVIMKTKKGKKEKR